MGKIASLGPSRYKASRVCPGYRVRINDDFRKAVVFFGHGIGENTICCGTGFVVVCEGFRYLVTAKHVAKGLGEDPFVLRVNQSDGHAGTISIDPIEDSIRWFFHDDQNVDLAILGFQYDFKKSGHEIFAISSEQLLSDAIAPNDVGVGDICYTVGLFRLHTGSQRNLPIVYSGNIALMAGEERVPVRDWDKGSDVKHISAHLVNAISVKGLSGGPVLVRQTVSSHEFQTRRVGTEKPDAKMNFAWSTENVQVLGVWQGSWDARPDEVTALEHGSEVRVPFGIGIVVPAIYIREILEMDEPRKQREEIAKKWKVENLATPDFVERPKADDGDKVLARMLNTPPDPKN